MVAPVESRQDRLKRQVIEIIKDSGNTSAVLILVGEGSGGLGGESVVLVKDPFDGLIAAHIMEATVDRIRGGLSVISSETVGWILMQLAEVQGTLDVVANRPLLVRDEAEAKSMLNEAETKLGEIKKRIRFETLFD